MKCDLVYKNFPKNAIRSGFNPSMQILLVKKLIVFERDVYIFLNL
jgi:hypothetical protein